MFLVRVVEVPKCLKMDVVCGNMHAEDNSISLHCFLSDPDRRRLWIRALDMQEDGIKMQKEWKDGSCLTCVYAGGHEDATFILRHKSHHFCAGAMWEFRGSAGTVFDASSSVSSTLSNIFATSLVFAVCADIN